MIKRSSILWIVLCLVLMPLLVGAGSTRGYGNGKYALELDGVVVGWLSTAEGGNAVAAVVTEKIGGDWLAKKHIAGVKYEDITVTFDANMGEAVYAWIKSTMNGEATRKNGAIIAADFDLKEQSRLTFTNALITEIGMPALDAASKDAAKMTIKFAPEYTRYVTSSRGREIPIDSKGKQKQWLPANFRLRIEGLEEPSARVAKIDAITVKQGVVRSMKGQLVPTKLEVPNLAVAIGDLDGDGFYSWAESSFTDRTKTNERNGSLEYLDARNEPLFTLTFTNLGIFKVAPDKMEAGAEGIRRVKAEMYCEDIRFSYSN